MGKGTFVYSYSIQAPLSDFRDWEAIASWAEAIAEELQE